MGTAPLPASSGSFTINRKPPLPTPDYGREMATGPSDDLALLGVLRQGLAAGTQSADSILHAVADAARVLTSADGTALALQTGGTIVCRARSGSVAPELGAPLNTESGISGESLRTATIQICHDARTDDRVDRDVCCGLGIRSIVVIPLHGPRGSGAGILEAFAARPNAFDGEALHALRALAEIAEAAYQRESRGYAPAPAPAAPVPSVRATGKSAISASMLFADPAVTAETPLTYEVAEPSRRRLWFVGGIVAAVLSTFAVAWWSWHVPAEEIAAASAAPPRTGSGSTDSSPRAPAGALSLKPAPGVIDRRSDRSRTGTALQNAAELDPEDGLLARSAVVISPPAASSARNTAPAPAEVEAPPVVSPTVSTIPEELTRIISVPATLPASGPRLSEGVVGPTLVHKVDPNYPLQARTQRLNGKVTLDATIGADGLVQEVKVVSGSPLLAAAATAALRQWRYRPALLNGSPVAVQKEITFVFTLP
ncbi:MAG TPA: TonB family protein [Candidatus Dormibacteraeota bacterium]|nr:TonB family protein [Candidatus Dormibacteraeota bacterium]